MFCEKSKYLKGTKTRETLIQCVDLRADQTIGRAATSKNDPRILAIVSRELVARKHAIISLVIFLTNEASEEWVSVVTRKKKMSVLIILLQRFKLMKY